MFNCVSFPKEAVSADQFHLVPSKVDHGNTYEGFEESKHRIHGEMRVGGQQPLYPETSSCVCVPKGEGGQMEIVAATDNLAGLQRYVSHCLGTPPPFITTRVGRLGIYCIAMNIRAVAPA